MFKLCNSLAEILETVFRPGDFHATGTVNLFMPHIEVEGIGTISLPILSAQAEQLIKVAERAPYGRGEDTLVDINVRRTWQIHPSRVRIEGKNWKETLHEIVKRVAADLGVIDSVEAEFYKLLVYDIGSFFVPHRDTEKAPGMFATLVMVLPSIYTGGELIVRHHEREARIDLCRSDLSEMAFAAFYADCVHEVLPITSGCRLTLIYNLVRKGTTQSIEPPEYDIEQMDVTKLLQCWVAERPSSLEENIVKMVDQDKNSKNGENTETPPEKIVYLLDHFYTPAELSFTTLKGEDAAIAPVLVKAAAATDCEIYLALASIEESGNAEYDYQQRSRRYRSRYDEEENEEGFVAGEVYDHKETLSKWCSPDGSRPEIGELPFDEEELCPPDAFNEMEPTEQHFFEATGNEGASFERTYHLAALVLWPQKRTLAVLNQAGLSATLPYLNQLVDRWVATTADRASLLWCQAHILSGYMIRDWEGHHYRNAENAIKMLTTVRRLGDVANIDAFVARIFGSGFYHGSEKEELIRAMELLTPQRTSELLERIIITNAPNRAKACSDLLIQYSTKQGNTVDLLPAMTALITALPGNSVPISTNRWNQKINFEHELIEDILITLTRIGASALAERTVEHILTWPASFPVDMVIIPVALRLYEIPETRELDMTLRLRNIGLEHLRQRLAVSLEPPRNWTRVHTLSCKCRHCTELACFLANPEAKVLNFKQIESDRKHLAHTIFQSKCDVDCTTLRTRPSYTLQCTKNQASYDRRIQEAEKDIALQNRLV